MTLDTSTAQWSIRPAQRREAAVVRRLVPALYRADVAPDRVLVAASGDAIVGVASIAWRAFGKSPGFPLHVHVIEAARRRGCGRALVRAAAEACRHDTDRLHGWDSVEEGTPAARFAAAAGFTVLRRMLHYETDGEPFYAMVAAIHARLRQRGAIPPDAHTVPLAEAPHAEVAALLSEAFGSRYDDALSRIRTNAPGGFDAQCSVVLIVDGRAQGALLYRVADGLPVIDVRVVSPTLRGRWANVLLMHDATRNGLAAGARRFHFHCEDGNADTLSLARRVGAPALRTALEFSAPLETLL